MTFPSDLTVYEDDLILQELGTTEVAWAEGGALYAAGGLFDPLRKSFLDTRAMAIRDAATEKLTEASLSQQAHADVAYKAFLDGHLVNRANWLALDSQRQRLWMKLKVIQSRGYEQRRMG